MEEVVLDGGAGVRTSNDPAGLLVVDSPDFVARSLTVANVVSTGVTITRSARARLVDTTASISPASGIIVPAAGAPAPGAGAVAPAIKVTQTGGARLDRVTTTGGTAGVLVSGGTASLDRVTVQAAGTGISSTAGASVAVTSTTVRSAGVGVHAAAASAVAVARSQLVGNVLGARLSGGSAASAVEDSQISGNDIGLHRLGGTLALSGNSFSGNGVHARGIADVDAALAGNTFGSAVVIRRAGAPLDTIWAQINGAIAQAASGDSVQPQPGTFSEAVTVNRSGVTLQPGGAALSVTLAGQLDVTASGITVKDLLVTAPASVAAGGVTLGQNTFQSTVTVGPVTNVAVVDNEFAANGPRILSVAADNAVISGNTVTGLATVSAIEVSGLGARVQDNDLTAVAMAPGAAAVRLGPGAHSAEITGNVVADNEDGIVIDGVGAVVDANTVIENVTGIRVLGSARNATIDANSILDNTYAGIFIEVSPTAATGDGHVGRGNLIVGNSRYGLNAAGPHHNSDFRLNWWGSPFGPTTDGNSNFEVTGQTGDRAVGRAEHEPWCLLADCADAPVQDAVGNALP